MSVIRSTQISMGREDIRRAAEVYLGRKFSACEFVTVHSSGLFGTATVAVLQESGDPVEEIGPPGPDGEPEEV